MSQIEGSAEQLAVWLDDVRPMPEGYDVHVKTAQEAINLLKSGRVCMISLDHDLGDESVETGYTVARYIEQAAHEGTLGFVAVNLHTANPVGRRNMEAAIRNAQRAWNQPPN